MVATFEVITSTVPLGTFVSVTSLSSSNPQAIKEIMIGITSSGISHQVRDIDTCTPYACAAGKLLHVNGKFTM